MIKVVWLVGCGRFPTSQKREGTKGNSTTESSPATTRAAPIAGLSIPSSIPIPVAATINGSEVACKSAAAREFLPPTIGLYRAAGTPRESRRARRNTGTSASAAPHRAACRW
jgi:hypothetical protein